MRLKFSSLVLHFFFLGAVISVWPQNSAARDSSGVVSYLRYSILGRSGLSETLIQKALVDRCRLWSGESAERCRALFKSYWNALETRSFSGHDTSGKELLGLVVVLKSELDSYLENDKLEAYFARFSSELENSPSVDFWEMNSAAFVDPKKRLRFMASIYQDTSLALAPLQYLHNSPELKITPMMKHSYTKLLITLSDRIRHPSPGTELSLLPTATREWGKSYGLPSTSNLYHFYVPAYLALKLKEEAKLSDGDAALMPFLLSFSYEMSSENWKDSLGRADSHRFGAASIDDLYMAYLGIHFALNGEAHPRMSRALFFRIFSGRPTEAFRVVIRSFGRKMPTD